MTNSYDVVRRFEGVKPTLDLFFKYNQSGSGYRLYCFVEGSDDKIFFEKLMPSYAAYSEGQIAYIFEEAEKGGKETVYNTLSAIRKNSNLTLRKGARNAFIVDRDYDKDGIMHNWFDKNVIQDLTVLPCYSIENYCLEPEKNLKKVFEHFFRKNNESEDYFADFKTVFKSFRRAIARFCSWKKICTLYPEVTNVLDKKTADSEDEPGCPSYILKHMLDIRDYTYQAVFTSPFVLPNEFHKFVDEAVLELQEKLPFLNSELAIYESNLTVDSRLPKGKILLFFLKSYIMDKDKELLVRNRELLALSGRLDFELHGFSLKEI